MLGKLNWIVIPGGPGLSNRYLKHSLAKPFLGCKLHFYNVLGSPESKGKNQNPSIDAMVKQISKIADEAGLREYGLITHSFGNYLAMRALETDKSSINAIIMLNPVPFEFHAWKTALANIVKKVSEPTLKEIAALSEQPDKGAELFRIIFPYYIGKKGTDLPIEVPFDIKACNSISEKVGEYDDRKLVKSTAVPLVRIVGGKDPFFDDREILLDQTIVMLDVGHYPFFEDPKNFFEAISKAGELLCRQTEKMTKRCC